MYFPSWVGQEKGMVTDACLKYCRQPFKRLRISPAADEAGRSGCSREVVLRRFRRSVWLEHGPLDGERVFVIGEFPVRRGDLRSSIEAGDFQGAAVLLRTRDREAFADAVSVAVAIKVRSAYATRVVIYAVWRPRNSKCWSVNLTLSRIQFPGATPVIRQRHRR